MKITTPQHYKAVFGEITFVVEQVSPSEKVDVKIYDSAQQKILGIKRFKGETKYDVNVAGYIQTQFDVSPITMTDEGKKCAIVCDSERIKSVSVKVGEQKQTDPVYCAFAAVDTPLFVKLSNAPQIKTIADKECDELSFIAPGKRCKAEFILDGVEKQFSFTTSQVDADHRPQTVVVSMPDVEQKLVAQGHNIDEFKTMTVEVKADDQTIFSQEYEIVERQSGAVRVCWVNRYGMIDYYSFLPRVELYATAQTAKIYTEKGYQNIASQTVYSSRIVSEYEPERTMNWLAEIIAAPKVMVVIEEQPQLMCVRSQSVKIASAELSRMDLAYVPIRKTVSQIS